MSNIAWFANLPHDTTEDAMRALASKAGKITNVEMGRRGMMSWVTYSTPAEASKALTLTGQMIGERDVRVELATRDPNAPPREKSPRTPREPRQSPVSNNAGSGSGDREPAPRYTDRILVKGVAPGATEEDVTKVFGSAGEILKIRIRTTETSIKYATAAAAQNAISLSGTIFEGSTRPLNIKFEPRRKNKRSGRKGGNASGSGESKPEGGAGRAPRAPRDPAAAPSVRGRPRRVDVKNVLPSASEGLVRSFFESCGAIDTLIMTNEVVTITFNTPEGAELALAKSGGVIGGGRVEVVYSPGRNNRTPRAPRAAEGDEPRAGRARRAPEVSPAAVSSLIWIGGLPSTIDEAQVRKMYGSFGKISEVIIPSMRDQSRPRFAYVRFDTDAAAANALAAPAGPGLTVQKANRAPEARQ